MNKSRLDRNWHLGINRTVNMFGFGYNKVRFMYVAKDMAEEAERLPRLFERERTGKLNQHHQQCSHSEPDLVPDNHLTCVLGIECRKCEFLLALEANSPNIPLEEMDKIKAWTCIAHILREDKGTGHIDTSEGMILTTDDRMFWDNVYRNLADWPPEGDS